MILAEARALCPDIVAIERDDKMTCLHIAAPYCKHPAHFFCVFYVPLTGGIVRRNDEPVAAPMPQPLVALADEGHEEAGQLSVPSPAAAGSFLEPAESSAVLVPEAPALEPPSAAEDGVRPRSPRLSFSAAKSWRTCPMLYNLRYIQRWTPLLEAPALVLSRLYDRGMQPIIQTGRWCLADLALTDTDRETLGTDGLAKLYASLDGFRDCAELKPADGVCQYPIRFRWCGENAIGYADYWSQPHKTIWEFKFLADIEVCPASYKMQMATYARALKAERIIYYPIRKPELRLKKGESSDDFQRRIITDIAKRPGHYYQPREYQPAELAVYLDDITPLEIRRAIENGKAEDFPRNWGACDMYTGCEFLPMCQSGGLVDEALYRRKA